MKQEEQWRRALTALLDPRNRFYGIPAVLVGGAVWGRNRRSRGCSGHGGGDYAAQMLLGRMRKAGLVRVAPGEGSSS